MRARLAAAALGGGLGGVPAVALAWLAEWENLSFLDDLRTFSADVWLPGALLGAAAGLAVGRGGGRAAWLGLALALAEAGALDTLARPAPLPEPRPVLVALAVDGLGSDALAAADLPNLAALVAVGASGTLCADPPLWPVAVAATLATGRPASHTRVHGWSDREESSEAAGILEIARHEGLAVQAEGWPDPSPEAPPLISVAAVKAEILAGTRWSTLREEIREAALDRLQPPDPMARQAARDLTEDRRARDHLIDNLARDPADLAVLHLGSVEACTHLGADPAGARGVVDEVLGELRAAVDPRGWLVIWSGWSVDASGAHQPDGLLVIVGPGVPPGEALGVVHAADLAPTLLGLLGLARGTDMKGKARFGAVEAPVQTWDALAPGGPHEGDEAAAREAALRALGYREDVNIPKPAYPVVSGSPTGSSLNPTLLPLGEGGARAPDEGSEAR